MGTFMSVMVGPDGQPSMFDGAAWVSRDGRFWWNGAAWQPIKKPGFQPPIALAGIILAIAGAWFVFAKVLPSTPAPAVVLGVSHSRIDSSSQIELDYARSTDCADLTFEFVFYDAKGKQVGGRYISDPRHNVTAGQSHHYVFYTYDSIPAAAVRFDAIPTCHS